MTRAFVRIQTPSGDQYELGHGDVIGRLWSVALPIQDPRVSEMHALVSLRGSALRLLGLRGRLIVDAQPTADLKLEAGQVVHLADGVALTVTHVALPDLVMGLEGDGVARQALPNVASLRIGARVELCPGPVADAQATIWSDGLGWHLRTASEERALDLDETFVVAGRRFATVAMSLGASGAAPTLEAGIGQPLHLVVRYDTVHVHRGDDPPLALDGIAARIVSELVLIAKPIGWEALAREIWRTDEPAAQLRKRWDVTLVRLRKKLRDARVRPDLVRANGTGHIELFLARGDTLDDQT